MLKSVRRAGNAGSRALEIRKLPRIDRLPRGASSGTRLPLDGPGWVRVFFPPPGGPELEEAVDPRLLAALRLPLRIVPWETA